jgi:hypothetical protein
MIMSRNLHRMVDDRPIENNESTSICPALPLGLREIPRIVCIAAMNRMMETD